VLRLAEQAYIRTGAWGALLDILPAMQKVQINDEAQRDALQQQAWLGLMNQAMADQGSDGLKKWWQNQSRKTRQETALQVAMAEHLIECDDPDTAQSIVLEGLKRQYDDRLVLLMPRIKSGDPQSLEKALRQQIKQHGATPLLHSTLGQLLMRHGEWQQAAEAFQQALAQRPDAFDYAWLADVYDRLHRPEDAAKMRREGLLLTLKTNPSA
jgi:HemY protein